MSTLLTAEYGVENIVKSFGGAKALSGVSLSVKSGEVHCIAGENGSGKSTLIKIMSGVHAPDTGLIRLGDKSFTKLSPREAVHEGVQVIFQDFSLLPNLSVAENIAIPTYISENSRFFSKSKTKEIAANALDLIGVDIDINASVTDISIASKQLIAIARATNQGVKMLFMDEPTTALTRKEIKHLFEVVEQLKERGVATIFVSHKIDEIQEICNTITILRNGEVVADGIMRDFKRDSISEAMTGLNVSETRIAPPLKKASTKVIEVRNLITKPTFLDISFSIAPGEILGITGLLGSGRTELAEAIFGQYPIDSGEVIVEGESIRLNSSPAALKAGIGYVPPDRLTQGLFLEQSILRNLVAVGVDQYQSRGKRLSKKRLAEAGEKWIKDLRIKTKNSLNPVTSLSGGNQQRVVLAKWLAMNPKLMILNGPTVGVDIGSKREILEIIRDRAQEGMGFLVVSDDIPELIQICHRVLVIKNGQISKEFNESELDEEVLYKELS
ncbi:sugar ABC transporter ATP-binding protein [Actinobacteria bacterium IMCC25003]|nr:sugar ABC transporter ATP-binding protein [Actinobacteria bacterium IMCC25003]